MPIISVHHVSSQFLSAFDMAGQSEGQLKCHCYRCAILSVLSPIQVTSVRFKSRGAAQSAREACSATRTLYAIFVLVSWHSFQALLKTTRKRKFSKRTAGGLGGRLGSKSNSSKRVEC